MNKPLLVLVAALLLGGCTLGANLQGKSATDALSPTPTATPTATPPSDTELEKMTPTSTGTDASSIEADLSSTVILEEDFSDLD